MLVVNGAGMPVQAPAMIPAKSTPLQWLLGALLALAAAFALHTGVRRG